LVSHAVPVTLALESVDYGLDTPSPQRPTRSRNQTPDEEENRPKWRIHVHGGTRKPSSDVGIYLAQFIVELEKSGYFSQVDLISDHINEETKEYHFEIKAFFKTGEEDAQG